MQTPAVSGGAAFASWGRRLGAILIDTLILVVVLVPLAMVLNVGQPIDPNTGMPTASPLSTALQFLIPLAYYVFMNGGARGQTFGKRALGIAVRRDGEGGAVGYGRALIRYLVGAFLWVLLLIPGLLNVLWPLWDAKKQALHDKAAGSVVVRA